MDNSRTVVVLGATDPEMVQIAALAREAGAVVVQATCLDEKTKQRRAVRPGEVPDRDGIDEIYQAMLAIPADRVLFVEQPGRSQDNEANNIGSWCLETYGRADNWPVQFVEVDHHDPRQVWPSVVPLWARSSLGQIAEKLGVQLTDRQRWVGALDHDLPGALYLARAENVLDEVLMIYAQGASHLFGSVEPSVYVRQARETEARLKESLERMGMLANGVVPIYRAFPPDPATKGATGEAYPLPALPLALALLDWAGLSIIRRPDGALAWRLQCAKPSQVHWFMAEAPGVLRDQPAPANVYGQPERGFAGGPVDVGWLEAEVPWANPNIPGRWA